MTAVIHPERVSAHARGDLAERMVPVAAELAFTVRDEDRDGIAAWLDERGIAPGDDGTRALLIVLAALVQVDATPGQMLEWVTWDEFGAPLPGTRPAAAAPAGPGPLAVPARFYEDCGTVRAYWRHRRAGHAQGLIEACGCGQAIRGYDTARRASRPERQAAAAVRRSRLEARIADYAERRAAGDSIAVAAGRLEISRRTAHRYEAALKAAKEAGRAA